MIVIPITIIIIIHNTSFAQSDLEPPGYTTTEMRLDLNTIDCNFGIPAYLVVIQPILYLRNLLENLLKLQERY